MKKVIQVVLAIAIVALAYVLYEQIMTPLRFQKTVKAREAAVIERIKDIRTAERAYKQVNNVYTGSFDTHINFVMTGTREVERKIYSEDDSVAMAMLKKSGRKNLETFTIAVIDTIFGTRKLTPQAVEQLRFIPFGNNVEFKLAAGKLETESKVVVPVFECKAPYKDFLSDLDHQELVNLIDDRKTIDKYPGIKVGSMTEATNDAGNWE